MPAIHNIDSDAQLIITTWEGEARDSELIAAIKKYQQGIQSNPDYIDYNEVLDLSGITRIKVTTNGVKAIGKIAPATDQTGKHKKLAVIVSSNLAYGLTRMYQAYRSLSKKSNKVVRIFKNKNDAFEWIKKQSIKKSL